MIWFLALRSLRLRPLRTFLTALGISVAVGSMVVFLSLGEGLRNLYASELGTFGPDIQVSFGALGTDAFTAVPELPIRYVDELEADAERHGIQQVTPMLFYVRGGFSPTQSFLFQALPADRDLTRFFYNYRILEGRTLTADDSGARIAVAGRQLATRARQDVGDVLRLNPQTSLEIVGIAQSDTGFMDNSFVVPLEALQAAIGIDDRVSTIALHLQDPARAAAVAEALAQEYPDLGFQTRGEVLGVIERGIQIGDVVRLGISVIALIVGAIAVANTVLMSVIERTREFGVVRALGARPRFLFGLVITEAIVLSAVGAVAGILIGRLGIEIVNHYALGTIGLEVAALTVRLILFSVAVAAAMGLVSGLLPAARAARIPITVAMSRE